jgi:uncharacterized protein
MPSEIVSRVLVMPPIESTDPTLLQTAGSTDEVPDDAFQLLKTKALAEKLVDFIGRFPNVVVAFSGGVDSSVVCQGAKLAASTQTVAITANSPSVASGEVDRCAALAERMGCDHVVIDTAEGRNPNYIKNSGDRCFWCKSELYHQIEHWIASQHQFCKASNSRQTYTILNGTNLDDLGDYRPGLRSAENHGVISPLVECGIDKKMVRSIAKFWKLPVWNKPAGPCLASRIAPGEEVTPQKLSMIDRAESCLHELGFTIVRVRLHRGNIARIEVPVDRLSAVIERHQWIDQRLRDIGFAMVSLDLTGFQTGSLNTLIQLD